MSVGIYSIVQYVADPERNEGINVGVILGVDRDVHLDFAPRSEANQDAVERFRGLLKHILASEYAPPARPAAGVLEELADRRFSSFRVLKPRQVDVKEDKAEATLEDLLGRLVASHEPSFR